MTSLAIQKVGISTVGQAHLFEAAKELDRRNLLNILLTSYPKSKMIQKGMGALNAKCYPVPLLATHLVGRLFKSRKINLAFEPFHKVTFDRWCARNIPELDLLISSSGSGILTGLAAKNKGAMWICDRGSSHIVYQNRILAEEYKRYGLEWPNVSQTVMNIELEEYQHADLITVPSQFAYDTFLQEGIPKARLIKTRYGIDLSNFKPSGAPAEENFQVIFAGQKSLRKGIGYLARGFELLKHPRKKLLLVGGNQPELEVMLKGVDNRNIEIIPAVGRERLCQLFSESQVMVLPSIEEGLALVMAQAMACGCPVIATENTGARDLFTDTVEGFCVPIRDPQAIADRLQLIADDPKLRERMSKASLQKVGSIGGWDGFVDGLLAAYRAFRAA